MDSPYTRNFKHDAGGEITIRGQYMKNYMAIAKRAYRHILMISELQEKLSAQDRKIQELTESLAKMKDCIESMKDGIKSELGHLNSDMHDNRNILNQKIDEKSSVILGEFALLEKQSEIRFWQNYKKSDENEFEARQRFFNSLPKATGGPRLLQQGNAYLLKKLSEICDKNGFTYWLQSGTLLGAVRHKGFVPWDDDTDCAMFRADIEKLRYLLKDNPDFQVTLIYDWWAKSRQIRFRPRDISIPCFVDIYIYDWCENDSDEYWINQKCKREEIIRTIENDTSKEVSFWREHPYLDDKSEQAPYIESMFQKFIGLNERNEFDNKQNISQKAVCWGLDNFSVNWKRLFDKDFLFPTVLLEYEGEKYSAPKEFLAYVNRQYGNIWELPHDLISHFHHVSHEELETDEMKQKISSFISGETLCPQHF